MTVRIILSQSSAHQRKIVVSFFTPRLNMSFALLSQEFLLCNFGVLDISTEFLQCFVQLFLRHIVFMRKFRNILRHTFRQIVLVSFRNHSFNLFRFGRGLCSLLRSLLCGFGLYFSFCLSSWLLAISRF